MGRYLGQTIDDYENQTHFISGENLKRAKSFTSDNIRKFSNYYIGKNTLNSLNAITTKAIKVGYERTFIFGIQKGQKELMVVDISKYAMEIQGTRMNFQDEGVKAAIDDNPNLTIVGWAHVHNLDKDVKTLNSPSAIGFGGLTQFGGIDLVDFEPYRIVNPFIRNSAYAYGYNPGITASKHGFNIHTTVGKNATLDLDISHYRIEERNVYNFNNQNRVLHDFPFRQ